MMVIPNLQVHQDAKKKKRDTTSADLRTDLKTGAVNTERRIYISFPRPNEHTTHRLGVV
jgi:hypothetical protein